MTAHRTLVRIHRAEGNLVEALRTYESFREVLAAEMGAAPSERMEALVAGLRCRPAGSTVVPLRGAGRRPAGVAATR